MHPILPRSDDGEEGELEEAEQKSVSAFKKLLILKAVRSKILTSLIDIAEYTVDF